MAFQFSDASKLKTANGNMIYLSGEKGIETDRHMIAIAGSRSGKGVGLIIPNLKRWEHNIVCIDPKGENAEITWQDRQRLGSNVYVLDPFRCAQIPDKIRASFNPLTSIDIDNDRASDIIQSIASGFIISHDLKHMEWTTTARNILSGIIAYVLVDAPSEQQNFSAVREMLTQPYSLPKGDEEEPDGLYKDALIMINDDRMGGLIRSAGIAIMTAIETDAGIEKGALSQVRTATQWLDNPNIKECLSHSSFDLSDLKTKNISLFLVLPPDALEKYSLFLRLFVKASLSAMSKEQGGKKCLFILDEFFALGKMEEISVSSGLLPSYGVHLFPFLQDLGQLYELYGRDGAATFFGNADGHIFFGNTDQQTLEYVSKQIGNLTPQEVVEAPPRLKRIVDTFDITFQENERVKLFESLERGTERIKIKNENDQREYQHQMRLSGTPRMPPEEIRKLTAKEGANKPSKRFIMLRANGEFYNLRLTPYYKRKILNITQGMENKFTNVAQDMTSELVNVAENTTKDFTNIIAESNENMAGLSFIEKVIAVCLVPMMLYAFFAIIYFGFVFIFWLFGDVSYPILIGLIALILFILGK